MRSAHEDRGLQVLVCTDTRGGAEKVLRSFEVEIGRRTLANEVGVRPVRSRGFDARGVAVVISPTGRLYLGVRPEDVPDLVESEFVKRQPLTRLLAHDSAEVLDLPDLKESPLFRKQRRITMRNCGLIDPESIEEYIARSGFKALEKALSSMAPEDVVREMKESGLRGRGGAGFSTGTKWDFCRRAPGFPKYIVCNADEGDPGAFMDRSILESDPHSVIEGMLIAGYAIGATEGFIYCREEYPLAIHRIELAIAQARSLGLLGSNILGTGFSMELSIKQGAGAFVCGEETALLASIEGRRGEPRPRPPYPAASGLWGKPTNINNVKSYATAPQIVLHGAKWFSDIGSSRSPGTAIFALTGQVSNTGLIEVPMGIPLGDIVFDIGGGPSKGKSFKAVQTGGPLGGCLPAQYLNTPVDFDSLQEAGAVMGSGGMIVVDEDTCMVELSRYFLTFAAAESCGKCVPCRVGGQRLLEALDRITKGKGSRKDLVTIREVSRQMMEISLCGLGQRTPGPVLAALQFFEAEFIDHIEHKICRAGQCKPLVRARCINSCPAAVDTPSYLAHIARGEFAEGLRIHRERNPFALICGRACPAFCERKCRRAELDGPVAVRMVKRFMSDHEFEKPWQPEPIGSAAARRDAAEHKIAVIGSGPGGLTAALRLAQRGYQVTVFEKLSAPGGMLTWAIPTYRLPRPLVYAEIDNIIRAGVELRCNQTLGRDFSLDDLFKRDGFSAVVLAIGAHHSRRLGIAGEEKRGVMSGVEFLSRIAVDEEMLKRGAVPGEAPDVRGKRVGVVGGGDVAIDVARCALRLGAKEVHVIYRRTGDDMPATHLPEEIEAAHHEGVHFHTLTNPVEVLGDETVTGVRLQPQRLAEFDTSARRKPVALGTDAYTLPIDMLIPAVSQNPDVDCFSGSGIETTRGGTIGVDSFLATSRPGVFALGDAVLGPSTIVQAVGQGNLVAAAVNQWLRTGHTDGTVVETPLRNVKPLENQFADFAGQKRVIARRLPIVEREGSFAEVELGLTPEEAQHEASRCLRCDLEWQELMSKLEARELQGDGLTETSQKQA